MNGKGSAPRPFGVPYSEYAANYDSIFGRQQPMTGHAAYHPHGQPGPFWQHIARPGQETAQGTKPGTKRAKTTGTKRRKTRHGKRRLLVPAKAVLRHPRKQD